LLTSSVGLIAAGWAGDYLPRHLILRAGAGLLAVTILPIWSLIAAGNGRLVFVADDCDAEMLQIFGRQARQEVGVDRVVAERRFVLPETEVVEQAATPPSLSSAASLSWSSIFSDPLFVVTPFTTAAWAALSL
jgi:hypothetical protein